MLFMVLACLAAPAPAATLAGGGNHSLGVRADGRVVAWGDNDYGQCAVPGQGRAPALLLLLEN
jgi:alpha-tubulin suppressor-like RCC1 family protein